MRRRFRKTRARTRERLINEMNGQPVLVRFFFFNINRSRSSNAHIIITRTVVSRLAARVITALGIYV